MTEVHEVEQAPGQVRLASKSLVMNRMEGCGIRLDASAEAMLRLRYDASYVERELEQRCGAKLRALYRAPTDSRRSLEGIQGRSLAER